MIAGGRLVVGVIVLAVDAVLERLQARSLAWRPLAREGRSVEC